MRVAVFGATGPAGRLVVERALAQGYEVIAYARSPEKLAPSAGLTVVAGSLSDDAAIRRAIHGTGAVISLLGPGPTVTPGELSGGVARIVEAARAEGVRRLVVLATPSAADPSDASDLVFRALVALVRLGVRPAYDEIVEIGRVVRGSTLDWTLVRVPLLTNGPATGAVRAGYLGHGTVRTRLSRADLAAFMVAQLEDHTWVGKAPAISS